MANRAGGSWFDLLYRSYKLEKALTADPTLCVASKTFKVTSFACKQC